MRMHSLPIYMSTNAHCTGPCSVCPLPVPMLWGTLPPPDTVHVTWTAIFIFRLVPQINSDTVLHRMQLGATIPHAHVIWHPLRACSIAARAEALILPLLRRSWQRGRKKAAAQSMRNDREATAYPRSSGTAEGSMQTIRSRSLTASPLASAAAPTSPMGFDSSRSCAAGAKPQSAVIRRCAPHSRYTEKPTQAMSPVADLL